MKQTVAQKIALLTLATDPKELYAGLLFIFDNMGEMQKTRQTDLEETETAEEESIYLIGECCLPFLSFFGTILNNFKADQIAITNLIAKIDFLEYQIFDTEFADKNKCLCMIKEIKDTFDSPKHTYRSFEKAA